jgi:hypothetical protein
VSFRIEKISITIETLQDFGGWRTEQFSFVPRDTYQALVDAIFAKRADLRREEIAANPPQQGDLFNLG